MRRLLRFLLPGAAAVFVAASVAVWGAQQVAAAPGPDLYIDIAGVDGCTTNSSPPPQRDEVVCRIGQGAQFAVRGFVRTLDGLSDLNENTVVGYAGLQFRFFYTDGLLPVDRPGETELGPPSAPYGPDCSIRAEFNTAGALLPSCLVAGETESTYVGRAVEVDFVCGDAGRHAITLDNSFSYLHNEFHGTAQEDDGDEVLTIECVAGSDEPSEPGPAAPDPSLLQPAQPDGEGLPAAGSGPAKGSGSPGLILGLAAGVAAVAAAVIGGGILLARRSRVG